MSRQLTRRLGYAGGALALAGGVLLTGAAPAAADLAEPAGACVATGSWQAGGFTVVSTDADPADVIEIPRADQVAWTGQVIGPDPGPERPIAGRISLQLPPPLVWVGLAGAALSAGLLALAGRNAPATGGRRVGRALAGGLLGVLLGFFGTLTLLVLGVVPLASPLVLLAVLAGAVAGAAWGGWSRWGRRPAPADRMAVAVDGR